MKSYKLSEAEDLLIGEKGTELRDEYELELSAQIRNDSKKNECN